MAVPWLILLIISTLKAHAFKVTPKRADIGQIFRLIFLITITLKAHAFKVQLQAADSLM
jgi:hypothetical protein